MTELLLAVLFLAALILIPLTFLAIYLEWKWYWLLGLIVPTTGAVAFGIMVVGLFSGGFDGEPVAEYRDYFFARLCEITERADSFAQAADTMQKEYDSGVFDRFIEDMVRRETPSIGWLFAAGALGLGVLTLIFRRIPFSGRKYILLGCLLLLWGVGGYWDFKYSYGVMMRSHVRMLLPDQKEMLVEMTTLGDKVVFAPRKCAELIRHYYRTEIPAVCHGEHFYGNLIDALCGKKREQ